MPANTKYDNTPLVDCTSQEEEEEEEELYHYLINYTQCH